ncbi:hypothetical protein OG205_10455 [Lentzea sp. NBC_00516]|uniref:hypothetical protein n=1 Tax=Lentzea sp. NBC_00516 TaxID=2903582 RepID=UPI002E80C0D4|nr:hypothetical protein [Lentzea sp. NBC_00516]WUD27390.1 hypothetical protein OG205_10455 [Lentzea sp. NBC_00516]
MTVASTPRLSVRGFVRRFRGLMALQGLDFAVRADEAHCPLGQYGARVHADQGAVRAHRPDEGEIRRPGETVEFGNPATLSTMVSIRRVKAPRRTCALLERLGHIRIFRDRTYHVDCKHVRRQVGKGRIGSHLPRSGPWRGWDVVSTGHPTHWSSFAATLSTRGRRRSVRAAEESVDERRRSWPNESACG